MEYKVGPLLPFIIGIISATVTLVLGSFILLGKFKKKPKKKVELSPKKPEVTKPVVKPIKLSEKRREVKKITLREAREKIEFLKTKVRKLKKRLEKIRKGAI